jgi:hypothetical protein
MRVDEDEKDRLRRRAIAQASSVEAVKLLMHDLNDLAEGVMEENALRVPSLGEPIIGKAYSTMVAGTVTSAVEAYVPVSGDPTLLVRVLEHQPDVSFNESEQALVMRYVADPLSFEAATRLFNDVIGRVRSELEQFSEEANEFNKGLERTVRETLRAAKMRVEDRRAFRKRPSAPAEPY